MPLCAVIVITSQQDTEKASADHESRGTQSLPRLSAMVNVRDVSDRCQIDAALYGTLIIGPRNLS